MPSDAFSGSLAATFAMRQAGLRVVSNDINHFSWLFATAFLTGSQPIGPNVPVARRVWHELKIECRGNKITGWLNGCVVMLGGTFTTKVAFVLVTVRAALLTITL